MTPPGPASITVSRRIHWFDTDTSTKIHNTAPLRLMEEAEAELLDRLGMVELYGRLPRAHVEVDFRQPLRFWDQAEVTVEVRELGRTSVTYGFTIRCDSQVCVEGRVVAVHITDQGRPRPWPEEYRRQLEGGGPQSA